MNIEAVSVQQSVAADGSGVVVVDAEVAAVVTAAPRCRSSTTAAGWMRSGRRQRKEKGEDTVGLNSHWFSETNAFTLWPRGWGRAHVAQNLLFS